MTAIACIAMIAVAFGAQRTWTGADVANNPSWSNGGNWQGGVAPVAGDTAILPDVAGGIVVSSDDVALFQSLPAVKGADFRTPPRILFRPTDDVDLTNEIKDVWFVKQGSGTTSLKGGNDKTYSGMNVVVESGAFGMQSYPDTNGSYYQCGHVVVSNGATLYLPYDGDTAMMFAHSLNNEGTITTRDASVSAGIRIAAGYDVPSIIGGLLQNKIDLQPCATNVYLVGIANTFTGNIRPWTADKKTEKSMLAVKKIGVLNEPSSCGLVTTLYFLYNGARYLYIGEGETTNRQIDWTIDWYDYTPYHEPEFDAGATGGVTFTGKWVTHGAARRSTPHTSIILSGSNEKPCVVDCKMETPAPADGTNYTIYITKRGTGTWRFNSNTKRENPGVLAVEEGTVQFESIEEKGGVCSLGLSTQLFKKHFGSSEEGVPVDYAFLLGTTNATGAVATEGVMEHVGTAAAKCSTRPFALLGNGRIVASGGALDLSGFSSEVAGERILTIAGTNSSKNAIGGITDGAGVVSVVKDGTNVWKLCGDVLDFSGDLVVKGGTVEVEGPGLQYTWFRFNSYEVQATRFGDPQKYRYQHKFDEFSLFDANGKRQNIGFTCPDDNKDPAGVYDVTGDASNLAPGTMCPGRAGQWYFYKNASYGLAKLTDQNTNSTFISYYQDANSAANASSIDRPDRRLSFAMRLTNGTPEIVRYDFCSSTMNSTTQGTTSVSNCPSTFSLEGSRDGSSWTVLHAITNNAINSVGGRWVSDDTPFNKQYTNIGFSVTGHTTGVVPLANVRSVSVAAGATLRAIGDVSPIQGLAVDANGAGTIDGFAFSSAAGCTLNVLNAGSFNALPLPGTYLNVTGLENVKNWTVALNGEAKANVRAVVSGGSIMIVKKGLILSIR